MSLSRDEFLQRTKRRYANVTLRDGQTVRLQSLTEGERSDFETAPIKQNDQQREERLKATRMRLLVRCIVDNEGKRLFGNEEYGLLAELDSSDTSRLFDKALEHTGFAESDVEAIAKNSPSTPDEDSQSS